LKPEHRDPNWAKGIPRDWIADELMEALLMLKRSITCEGRYSMVFLFHLRFMLHLAGIKRMNLPYYFLRDLNKMAIKVQENAKTPPHRIYHQGLIKVLVKAELGKLQKTWDKFLIQSGFEKKVYPSTAKSHDKGANLEQETSSSTNRSTNAKKRKRTTCVKISDEPVEAPPTSQQENEGSSRILGGGKHPFPFAQKTYSRRTQRQVKSRVLGEDKKPETTKELVEPVQPKDHSPKVILPNSSSSQDNVSQYKIVMQKRGTRPQKKFRMKSKAVYKPAITEKVIFIDEELVKPMKKPPARKKIPVTKPEKNKFKKGGLITNKKTITGKKQSFYQKTR
jgi:hypothetical protein